MPFAEVNLVPSVNIESTPADNPSGVQESQFIRWKAALPEKRGGCTLFIQAPMDGIPRDIQPWGGLNGERLIGTATTQKVYAYSDNGTPATGVNTEISPQYKDTNNPPKITVKKNETKVIVYDPGISGVTIYDAVTFYTPVSVGGIFLLGTYQVIESYGLFSYIIDAGYPAVADVTLGGDVPVFTTTAGTQEVRVSFPIAYQPAQLKQGDVVGYEYSQAVTLGGITIEGQYVVNRVLDLNTFIIVDNESATFNATAPLNGGNAALRYWIPGGPPIAGAGYGINPYGGNNPPPGPPIGWGQGQPIPPITNTLTYSAPNWYLDNRGSTLVAAAEDGPIFFWDRSTGFRNMSVLPGAPVRNKGAFQAMPQGNIMAWGCSDTIDTLQNPLYIRWSDSNDPTVWAPTLENNAGFYNMPTGSKIVRGIQGPTQQYWFTDVDVYVAQYIGGNETYGFNKIGNGCGLVATKAVTTLNSNVYWMSQKQFFVCPSGGAPQPIPCSVWDFLMQNINEVNLPYVVAGANSIFNEVNWFFPAIVGPDNLPTNNTVGYVCYNSQYNEWDVGYLDRTAWFDQSLVGPPIATDSNGWLYQHETSNDLAVGLNIVPIDSWLKTGYFSLSNGQDLQFCDWFLPDMKWGQYSQPQNAQIKFTFYVTDYAGQTPRVYGPYTTTKDTPFICPRFRGRFVAMKVQSTDLGSFWRLGSLRYRYAPSGRR